MGAEDREHTLYILLYITCYSLQYGWTSTSQYGPWAFQHVSLCNSSKDMGFDSQNVISKLKLETSSNGAEIFSQLLQES